MNGPRNEFTQALKALTLERGLDAEVILEAIKEAVVAAYRRDAKEQGVDDETLIVEAEINPANGEARVFSYAEGKPAKRKDVTPPGFGRIAATTAKQVIHQKIREAEKTNVMDEYEGKVGQLVSGLILRFDGQNVRVDLGRVEAIMPATERVATERLSLNQRATFLLKGIVDGPRGKDLILSRADPKFVEKLMAREVPEVNAGTVEVKLIVREPGVRTKMVVGSSASGIDAVGSCVGQKGVRIQAVTNELGGERIDVIPFTENVSELVASALTPATQGVVVISRDKKSAVVKFPADQLPLAIGRDGWNVKLASMLTKTEINVESNGDEGEEVTKENV